MLQFFILFLSALMLLAAFIIFTVEQIRPGFIKEYIQTARERRRPRKKKPPVYDPVYTTAYYLIMDPQIFAALPPARRSDVSAEYSAQLLTKAFQKMQQLLLSDLNFVKDHCFLSWTQAGPDKYAFTFNLAEPNSVQLIEGLYRAKVHSKTYTLAPNQMLAFSQSLREFYRILGVYDEL